MLIAPESKDSFNIVVVGDWNPLIFQPDWVKEHLASIQEIDVVLAISLQPNSPARITIDNEINIYPSSNLLIIDCVEYNDASLRKCAQVLEKICSLLPHTPIKACGINFRFIGALEDSPSLTDLFTFSDAGKIAADDFLLSKASIKRSFKLNDSSELNLNLDLIEDTLKIEFNFHLPITSLSDVPDNFSFAEITQKRTLALSFLNDVYEIEINNIDQE